MDNLFIEESSKKEKYDNDEEEGKDVSSSFMLLTVVFPSLACCTIKIKNAKM